jgi:O-antigen/teichoic acid export membrane protein
VPVQRRHREQSVLRQSHDEIVARALKGLFGRDSLYTLIWALELVAATVVTPLITRVMKVTEFGAVAAAIAVMQVIFLIAGLGLHSALQRQYARPGGQCDAARVLMFSIVMAILVTAAADSTGHLWSHHAGFDGYNSTLRLVLYWAGVSAVTNTSLALLRSQNRLLAFSSVSLLQSVVAEAGSLALVVLSRPTAEMFVFAQLVMQIIATVVGLALAPPKILRFRDRKIASGALVYSLPLIPSMLSTFVLSTSDRLIVQAELGLDAVARYQVAYNVGAMPTFLLAVLSNSWMPRIFSIQTPDERAAVLAASRDALYRLLTPVIIGLSVGAPIVLRVWAPAEYRPDELMLVTSVVIVAAIPYTAGLSATRALLAEDRTVAIAAATITAAIVNILLNLLLVPHFKLVGSAIASLFAYTILHGLLLIRTTAAVRSRPTSPLVRLELAIAAVIAMTVPALPTSNTFLAIRSLFVIACLGWFGWSLVKLSRPHPDSYQKRSGFAC